MRFKRYNSEQTVAEGSAISLDKVKQLALHTFRGGDVSKQIIGVAMIMLVIAQIKTHDETTKEVVGDCLYSLIKAAHKIL